MSWIGMRWRCLFPGTENYQALSHLRNTVVCRMKHCMVKLVAEAVKFIGYVFPEVSAMHRQKPCHVLKEEATAPNRPHSSDKVTNQAVARIGAVLHAAC